ncbi:MAG: TraR/DksA family transcriptional regulator [Candidatus Brocadiaceae bacterium]|nr:TraR/DksA family transcriptional regulator [Candidatus Brocadiaceae bacterium]
MKRTKRDNVSKKAIERSLQDLEKRLKDELHQHLGKLRNVSGGQPSELLDIVAEGELDFMSARSAEAGSTTIAEVRLALEKLRQGTYGVCDDCGRQIAPRRLKARPFATLCLSCKEQQERMGYSSHATAVPVRTGAVAVSLTGEDLHESEEGGSDLLRDIEDLEVNEMF